MTTHLAIDDTAVRADVEELLELIGVQPQSGNGHDALVITDRYSHVAARARAVIRIGTDIELPRDAGLLLDLVEQEESTDRREPGPVIMVGGASAKAPVTSIVGRALAQYRGGRPLTVIDLGDDPSLRTRIARAPIVPEIIPWKNIAVDEPVISTRLGQHGFAIVCGHDSPPPNDPVPWINSLIGRGPIIIDAGRMTAACAGVARQVATHVVISHRYSSTFQVRAAIERLAAGNCEIIVSGRRPRASWATRAQWRPFGVTRLIARLLAGKPNE